VEGRVVGAARCPAGGKLRDGQSLVVTDLNPLGSLREDICPLRARPVVVRASSARSAWTAAGTSWPSMWSRVVPRAQDSAV
jgi:hypothetical protein